MHKLKYDFLMQIYEANPTKGELNTILYLCKHQDEQGKIIGVHYRNVVKEVDFCNQSFYRIIPSLEDKGLISYVHHKDTGDYDITLNGNDFSDGDYSCGYISLRRMVFNTGKFKRLKANEMLLVLRLLYLCQSNGGRFVIGRNTFIETYMDKLGVKKRAIEKYLHVLRQYFDVRLDRKLYTFIPKNFMNRNISVSDETFHNEYVVATMARRQRIRKVSKEEVAETAKLVNQYKEYAAVARKDIWGIIQCCLVQSLEYINRDKRSRERKEYSLRYKLIHKLLRKELNMA